MTFSREFTLTTPSDLEVRITRGINASRERVFAAYTDPKSIPLWWGPRHLVTTIDAMDVRVGGRWRFVQRDAEGKEYAFNGVYQEISPPERLTYTFEFEPYAGHILTESVEFEDHDGMTMLIATMTYPSKEDRDGMLASGMEGGSRDSMDRIEELLTPAA